MKARYYNSIRQKIIKRRGYSVFIIGLLLFLQCIVIPVNGDSGKRRWGHSSILINKGLYVYGGRTDPSPFRIASDASNINELLYLDVSQPFNDPPWVTKGVGIAKAGVTKAPLLSFHSCNLGGSQNESFVLFGGESNDQGPFENSLFVYDPTTSALSAPLPPDPPGVPGVPGVPGIPMTGIGPSRRRGHTAVTISPGNSLIWGGATNGDVNTYAEFSDLYKLTVTESSIIWVQLISAKSSRWEHSATLLSDGKMYIIGGMSNGILSPMTDIPVYDTNQGTWDALTAVGDQILPRRSHGAVGTEDNRIIIYGGAGQAIAVEQSVGVVVPDNLKYSDVAVLKVTDGTLTWTIPQQTGTVPPGRYDHTMTLVGTKAIITYGLAVGFVNDAPITDQNLFVLDVNSFTWDTSYAPSATKSPETTTTDSTSSASPTDNKSSINDNSVSEKTSAPNEKKLGLLVGVPISVIVVVLGLGGLFCFWFKRRKKLPSFSATPYEKQQASIPPIAGPVPLYNLSSSQGGAGGSTNVAPFIPPFATSSYQRRQSSFGSIGETRNLTPADQHDSWGSAPNNSSQSQLPQINANVPKSENYQTTTPQRYYSSTPPTPPSSTPTPPPAPPQKDLFLTSATAAAAAASTSTKTSSKASSPNLRLDSDSNTAPVEYDFNLPPVPPLSINPVNRSNQTQVQAQQQPPQLPPISTSLSPPQDSSNALTTSPTNIEAAETSTSTEDERGFHSPLLRSETLSALAGTADRNLSLRTAHRFSGRRGTLDGSSSRPTSPTDNIPDNQPRGRLFPTNPPDIDDDSE